MKDSYFVIFNKRGIDRFTKTENFKLNAGEHAMQVELEVPDEVFRKPPIPKTRILVDPSQVVRNIGAETDEQEQEGAAL